MSHDERGLASPDDAVRQPNQRVWTPVDTASTMEEAKNKIKASELGKWKWFRVTPGDGIRMACFQCNAHLDCGRLMKAVVLDENYSLQVTGQHSAEMKEYKRVNSTLTYEQEASLTSAMNAGGRPAAVRVSMTKTKLEELCKAPGGPQDPLEHKIPEGGLDGTRILARECIPYVSRMYSKPMCMYSDAFCMRYIRVCILQYPACIPHVC